MSEHVRLKLEQILSQCAGHADEFSQRVWMLASDALAALATREETPVKQFFGSYLEEATADALQLSESLAKMPSVHRVDPHRLEPSVRDEYLGLTRLDLPVPEDAGPRKVEKHLTR